MRRKVLHNARSFTRMGFLRMRFACPVRGENHALESNDTAETELSQYYNP